jgi:hypothetical protein
MIFLIISFSFSLLFTDENRCHPIFYFISFAFAQDLQIGAGAFLALDTWYGAPTPRQILQVGLLHSRQIPPPGVSNPLPQT